MMQLTIKHKKVHNILPSLKNFITMTLKTISSDDRLMQTLHCRRYIIYMPTDY